MNTVEYVQGNILIGGSSLSPTAPAPATCQPRSDERCSDQYLTVPATGGKVWNSQISHDGSRMLVEGPFTSVGGQTRHQISMLNLGQNSASLSNWYSNDFNTACVIGFYTRDAAWSPDDDTVYVATTGAWPTDRSHRSALRPCDAAIAYPATATTVNRKWINYTGCDSLYSVEATNDTVYIGGHERWANNPIGCDFAGPGALSRPGLAALNASTGSRPPGTRPELSGTGLTTC